MVEDKCYFVYFVFIMNGIGILMPWNMFITSKAYFSDFKLVSSKGELTVYSKYYLQYVGFCSMLPGVSFMWLNIFVNFGSGGLMKRILFSIWVLIILFVFTILMAVCDTSHQVILFFVFTMLTVILLNSAIGVYQSSLYGIAASLPPNYTGGIILGNNINGVFVTLLSILFQYLFATLRRAAIYSFLSALFFLFICHLTFLALRLNEYFRSNEVLRKNDLAAKLESTIEDVPFLRIWKQAFLQVFNAFLVFFVTLTIFPAVHSDIQATNPNFIIPPEYFALFTCYLVFNVFAMLGSLTSVWVKWPSPQTLVIATVLRLFYIPLFLLCNYNPKGEVRQLPVVIGNEWVYIFMGVTMSYTHGYFSALAMMYAPLSVTEHQDKAGMFACAMLMTGIFVGIIASFLWPHVVAM
ncbi:equilibrative nucleoside transporter 1-like [Teleopsis dalmanni]|uniref:equilibrative nucleoside transporter 1-like n=1 Tax=Teleopsis dalmanni TaxID=139649 RepID=UPI0018CCAD10|nr:equilibrative nucleoside transporter 1-like [Teleopsis dalmanni]